MSDLQASLQYLLIIELLGLAVLPLSYTLFFRFIDKGFALSKILGILLTSWLVWMVSSLHIAPFTRELSFLSIGLFIVLTWGVSLITKNLPRFSRTQLVIIALEELLFLFVFAGWTYVRGFSPDLNGLEKFMDYGFMLSILRTPYFPPLDHFLASEPINYYYFGHYIASFITRLAHVPPSMGYNLQMSLLMALASLQSFSLGVTLVHHLLSDKKSFLLRKSLVGGLLSFLFVVIFGNLHAIIFLPTQGASYWYPNATRFIQYTIHEFPIYSFIVNDLHGHVSSIPFVLLTLALLFVIFLSPQTTSPIRNEPQNIILRLITYIKTLKPLLLPLMILSLTIGSFYATNAWDFAIYFILTGMVLLARNVAEYLQKNTDATDQYITIPPLRKIITSRFPTLLVAKLVAKTAGESILLLGISILLFLPFWQNFYPISQGIGLVPFGSHSPIWQLAILWGIQVTLGITYLIFVKKTSSQHDGKLQVSYANLFILLLCMLSFILIVLPEIIFVRDIYPTHFRANTMFKFFYQAWLMLGIVSGVSIVVLLTKLPNRKFTTFIYIVLVSFFLLAGTTYALKATEQGFGGFNGSRRSLDGAAYLSTKYPADAQAIDWINKNITGQPVIAEAVGESYTDYARVATYTGIPTVMGWPVHEWLWRGGYLEPFQPPTQNQLTSESSDSVALRVDGVKLLYETTEQKTVQKIVKEYHIDYIFMGTLEREKYKVAETISKMYPTVYGNDGTFIYSTK